METLTLTRQGTQSELTDFVRTRTELECIIEDLRSAGLRTGGKRAQFEEELSHIDDQIAEKEGVLGGLMPEWDAQRTRESMEKRKLDDANAKLAALFAKQGRVKRFRNKAERDSYLKHEIASMEGFQKTQTVALEATHAELATSRQAQTEIEQQVMGVHGRIEDGRKRVRDLGDQVNALKDTQSELIERRKDLWREDTKLESLVSHAADELRSAERVLAGMMDKVRVLVTTTFCDRYQQTIVGYWYGSSCCGQNC